MHGWRKNKTLAMMHILVYSDFRILEYENVLCAEVLLCASGMYNKEESKVEKDYEKGFNVCDDGAGIRGAVRL